MFMMETKRLEKKINNMNKNNTKFRCNLRKRYFLFKIFFSRTLKFQFVFVVANKGCL